VDGLRLRLDHPPLRRLEDFLWLVRLRRREVCRRFRGLESSEDDDELSSERESSLLPLLLCTETDRFLFSDCLETGGSGLLDHRSRQKGGP
jgi:hypothetical protein